MKLIKTFVAVTSVFFAMVAGGQAQATPLSYNFKYTFVDRDVSNAGPAHVVTGSFIGDANGNLITGIANATASIDGVASSSPLFADSFNVSNKTVSATGAVVSFDGLSSNFIFTSNAIDLSNANYFYVIPWANPGEKSGSPTIGAQAVWPTIGVIDAYNGQYVVANWSVTAAAVADVPEPASIALIGIALLGMGIATRKRGIKR